MDNTQVEDNVFEFACIRDTLDDFLAHASRTVSGHVSQVKFTVRYTEQLEIPYPFSRLGQFPLRYHNGMKHGVMVIMRSLEPGKGCNGKVKQGTMRRP